MKLLNRTIYMLITTILLIFFVGSIVFYLMLKSTSEKEMQKELESRIEFMIHEFKNNPAVYKDLSIPGYLSISEVNIENITSGIYRDTIMLDESDGTYKQYKTLSAVIGFEHRHYQVIVYKSLIESDELVERITLIVTIIVLLFIIFIYLLNRFMFQRVWADFFNTLAQLKSYDVNQEAPVHFKSSDILEFELLNVTLNQMMEKIQDDYQNIREFTGNISHEIQTPLTIIMQKYELLLQTEPLNKKQLELIRDIQKTNTRLSKLNKTLVLLTKIESKQFSSKEQVSVKEVIIRHLENFQSIAKARNIEVNLISKTDISIMSEPMLIDVLIVNLIKNAVSHNVENGSVEIELDGKELSISNTGAEKDLSGEKIFERYQKLNRQSETLGLGLSLVKKICDLYSYSINYQYSNQLHTFIIRFVS